MKKLTLLAALSAAALTAGVATTASAQGWGHGGGWMSINERQARLDARIDAGLRRGEITRVEARRLRAEFNGIARLEARYRRGGLSNWERADLDRRFDRLSAQIRVQAHDGDRYGYGYGDRYRH